MADELEAGRNLVVIGASAGGVETLKRVVAGLPANLPATLCVVVHIARDSPSALARILGRAGPLKCRQASDGDPLSSGEILVAPPDHHLVIEDGHVHVTVGPRENGHRPAVDPLFRSAADSKDGKVIGVVLSGNRDDGAAGLAAIKANGGATIVQDPEDALYSGMPASALANVVVDAIVPSDRIADAIAKMVQDDHPVPVGADDPDDSPEPGRPALACPECGGVLVEERQAGVPQWRCRVGHRYSPESLADEQATSVEAALWIAIRALEERGSLLERMSEQSDSRNQRRSAKSFRQKAQDAREQAELAREALRGAVTNTLREIPEEEHARAAEQR